jgi:uncharacterized protein (TIGR00645 family)
MKKVELLIERILLGCRWLLVVFYGGLAVGLGAYAINFIDKVCSLWTHVLVVSEKELLLNMLALIDATLVAGLTVMVMISGYENFVSRFDDVENGGEKDLAWLGKLDTGGLKLKLAASIVAISSIGLLEVFLNIDKHSEAEVRWSAIIYLIFVVSAVLLGLAERLPVIWKGNSHE